ncbi:MULTISPECIES: DUF262 domain-containing protein [unclassified Corallococcus]|uniref:DUF262 domain-containing protein n=1 Tax=unclassified Corallococcus TaxID=2685029 RepID=UPI001A8D57D9|nr:MULTISPECIES: DUF262 domain-containing protein [unclassified Corallococcus]MBN9683586.1 DUF262 domain-containing protein [Corallococcus sp. NCSPR001]WAS84902.1 DUF262 domain-containing protein [Corallococcus sp. NCRR]
MPAPLTRRPETKSFSIEDLLDRVRRGEVRIPDFQRPLRWTAEDVRDLLDSVYRGYPIGTLLFWRREAPAANVSFGPVRIDAPSTSQGLWAVDGQQRVTALAGVLLHPSYGDEAGRDDFHLYFDLETEELHAPPDAGPTPPHWLPMNEVLDSESLLHWLNRYPGREAHPEHLRAAIRLGKAIREYQVPAYVVDTADEKVLRIIFKRLNTAGRPLTDEEVFNALYVGSRSLSLESVTEGLRELGFGSVPESLLLRAVLAVRGLDFTRGYQEQLNQDDELTESVRRTDRALRDAIVFLKRDAFIPHLKLLPAPENSLVLLTRFFQLHPEPTPRSRELLSRWIWRHIVFGGWELKPPEALQVFSAIRSDEERSLQTLLGQIPPPLIRWWMETGMPIIPSTPVGPPLVLRIAMLSLQPRDLRTGAVLEPGELLELPGEGLQPILPPGDMRWMTPGIVDRRMVRRVMDGTFGFLFHPPVPGRPPVQMLEAWPPLAEDILQSHGLTQQAIGALRRNDGLEFLQLRQAVLEPILRQFMEARTRWDDSDRPSLQSMIIDDDED